MEPLSRDVCVLMCKTVLALCGLGLEIVYLVALIHVRLYISIAYCYDIFVCMSSTIQVAVDTVTSLLMFQFRVF